MKRLEFARTQHSLQFDDSSLLDLLRDRLHLSGPWPGPARPETSFAAFELDAWNALISAVFSDQEHEQIGVFHGRIYSDRGAPFLLIRHALHAKAATAGERHAHLDANAWAMLHAEVKARGLDLGTEPLVGWWHTHPNLGAFFSDTDQETQGAAFPLPHHVAMVFDPIRGEMGTYFGGSATPSLRAPIIVGQQGSAESLEIPALALVLPLDAAAEDLRGAAVKALRDSGIKQLLPWPKKEESIGPALVFDRADLKQRLPDQRPALEREAKGEDGSFGLLGAIPPQSVIGVRLAGGVLRTARDLLGVPGQTHASSQ